MPEYLSPGVYVEEIDTGNKPIEGVSTSTAGMEGLTERGPVNVPILVTSYGEYTRWFGGYLPIDEFSNASGVHCYLPHAVEGFFTNGGKRAYITRVAGEGALRAEQQLFDRGSAASADTLILRAAGESTGTVANPPLLYVLDPANVPTVAPHNWIRIGDGSRAEYKQVTATAADTHIPLSHPLNFLHETTAGQIKKFPAALAFGGGFTLSTAVNQGAISIVITTATVADLTTLHNNVAAGKQLLEIGGTDGEHHFATNVTISGNTATVILEAPLLLTYPVGSHVDPLTLPAIPLVAPFANLLFDANTGDSLIFADNLGAGSLNPSDLVLVTSDPVTDPAGSRWEVRRIGSLRSIDITPGAYAQYPADSLVRGVTLLDDDRQMSAFTASAPILLTLNDVSSLTNGETLFVDTGIRREPSVIASVFPATNQVQLVAPLANPHAPFPVPVTRAYSLKSLTLAAPAGSRVVALSNRISLSVGDVVRIGTSPNQEYATIIGLPNRSPAGVAPDAGNVVLDHALVLNHPSGDAFRRQTTSASVMLAAPPAIPFLASIAAGALPLRTYFVVITYSNLQTGETTISPRATIAIAANDVMVVTSPASELGVGNYKVYASTVSGAETLQATVAMGANWTEPVTGLVAGAAFPTVNTATVVPITTLVLTADQGVARLLLSDGSNFPVGTFLSVTNPQGESFYHSIDAATPAAPVEVTLQNPLERAHAAGSPVVGRDPLIQVQALDVGAWGNRLRISVQDESPGLVSQTTLTAIINPTHVRLASAAGVEPGTILELLDPLNQNAVVYPPLKVMLVDRTSNNTVTLQAALTGAQMTAQANAVLHGQAVGVRSREFRMTVQLLHQPDPALPTRDNVVIDAEVFRNLSMDPRHSRYVQTIIGDIQGLPLRLEDRRPEGQSWYVRVRDLAQDLAEPGRTTTLESVRLGPETLVDELPSGAEPPAQQALEGGDDSIGTVVDDTYIGQDNADPERRTGLFSLVNIDEVSIIAVPGRRTPAIQGALIAQCETLRYRFAVLDGPAPPGDSLSDVQNQRQQFDTEYAALYHPWLLIEDPFPTNLQNIPTFPIPPSGHLMGVYARTDGDRGVHKAPANEVVNGIIGLQRALNKGEQDILNPYPVNINVIRDFRKHNRSIRVWGARVITSDPDWIYVNVRRLMIFLEKSIDLGLQWVVFEPNAEPLWARVKRTITNFLSTVWRNGALEGTKPEEAFFVKCDRTTMTQDDIDSGRLIVVIGVAPVRPAEFVIIRIGLWTAGAQT